MHIVAIVFAALSIIGFIWWLAEIIPTAIYYPFLYTTGQWTWMITGTALIGIAIGFYDKFGLQFLLFNPYSALLK